MMKLFSYSSSMTKTRYDFEATLHIPKHEFFILSLYRLFNRNGEKNSKKHKIFFLQFIMMDVSALGKSHRIPVQSQSKHAIQFGENAGAQLHTHRHEMPVTKERREIYTRLYRCFMWLFFILFFFFCNRSSGFLACVSCRVDIALSSQTASGWRTPLSFPSSLVRFAVYNQVFRS